MTEKSNLEDDLFDSGQPDVTFSDHVDVVHQENSDAFLRDILGPAAEEAMKQQELKTPQEQYNPKKPTPPRAYVTSGGKQIKLEQDFFGKWTVHFVPGGEMPAELKGQFTREDLAHEAVQLYLAKREAG